MVSVRHVLFLAFVLPVILAACGQPPTPTPTSSPSPSPAPTTPRLGDACLVGPWTLDKEVYVTTRLNGKSVTYQGYKGETLVLDASGQATFDFTASGPEVATDGSLDRTTLRGILTYSALAQGGFLSLDSPVSTLTYINILSGKTTTGTAASPSPSRPAYTCSPSQLIITSTQVGNVYTDTFFRSK